MEEEPKDVLQRVIQQRKDMQGLDLQNVEFQSILGQGSFGVVYKGRWRSLTVAVKVLMFQDASEAKRIRQRAITEAAINTLLTHDNIVNTYTHGELCVCLCAHIARHEKIFEWKALASCNLGQS